MHKRTLAAGLILLSVVTAYWPLHIQPLPQAEAGGVPEQMAPDLAPIQSSTDSDIMRTIVRIPHDPNPLGVRQALRRTERYSHSFAPAQFPSADGTPLAGMLGIWPGGRPRPGVVLANGLTQTKDMKALVEIAELFFRNGWHVLAFDPRGHGDSRRLSPAMMTGGWKESEDVLGAARALRDRSGASSVAVIGFSQQGRALVKAMAQDEGGLIAAGIGVTAPLGAYQPLRRPDPGWQPNPIQRYFLDFLGARSFYEYYDRSARFYGIDLPTLERFMSADGAIVRVAKPLLMLYALDDILWLQQLKDGRHDGGILSFAYRETVKDHPYVRTLLVNRGDHSTMLYLSDPHWFGRVTLTYLKHWLARDEHHVTVALPPLDVLAEGLLEGQTVRYRLAVRNHGPRAIGPVEVYLDLPNEVRLESCWVGFEGLGRCEIEDNRVKWTMPRLSGGKTTVGPFVATINITPLKPGTFDARAWITTGQSVYSWDDVRPATIPQSVTLTKP